MSEDLDVVNAFPVMSTIDQPAVYFWFPYVFEQGQNGHICKIGRTTNLEKRMATISTYSPYNPWLVLALKDRCCDVSGLEKIVHDFYSAQKMRNEWFLFGTLDVWNLLTDSSDVFSGTDMQMVYRNPVTAPVGYFPSEYPPGHKVAA